MDTAPTAPPPHKKGASQEKRLTIFPTPFLLFRQDCNQIFLIYKKIQNGAIAKSYMRKGFLIYEEMHKYLTIYEEAVSHVCMSLQLLHYEFPDIWGKFTFLFYQCTPFLSNWLGPWEALHLMTCKPDMHRQAHNPFQTLGPPWIQALAVGTAFISRPNTHIVAIAK